MPVPAIAAPLAAVSAKGAKGAGTAIASTLLPVLTNTVVGGIMGGEKGALAGLMGGVLSSAMGGMFGKGTAGPVTEGSSIPKDVTAVPNMTSPDMNAPLTGAKPIEASVIPTNLGRSSIKSRDMGAVPSSLFPQESGGISTTLGAAPLTARASSALPDLAFLRDPNISAEEKQLFTLGFMMDKQAQQAEAASVRQQRTALTTGAAQAAFKGLGGYAQSRSEEEVQDPVLHAPYNPAADRGVLEGLRRAGRRISGRAGQLRQARQMRLPRLGRG